MHLLDLIVSIVLLLVGFGHGAYLPARTSGNSGKHTVLDPGAREKVMVTAENTLNGTCRQPHTEIAKAGIAGKSTSAGKPLALEFVNNLGGSQIHAYIQGLDVDGKVLFVRGDGSLLYPSSGGSQIPVLIDSSIGIPITTARGSTFRMTLPGPLISARVYFSRGPLKFYVVSTPVGDGIVQPSVANLQDPNSGTSWGFVEFTYNSDGSIFANISYVDFVGMVLGMSLQVGDGSGTQLTRGLSQNAVSALCDFLAMQGILDGRPWGKMCVWSDGGPVRVLSPNIYQQIDPKGFASYWDAYVDKVWSRFNSSNLTIRTQTDAAPDTQCRVISDQLVCNGDSRPFSRPSAADIWGCNSGPFLVQEGDSHAHVAVIPRLCAAFERSTLLLEDGNVQPGPNPSEYYLTVPTNHYSRLVHGLEQDGVGYAFSYDDVNPDGVPDSSGSLHSGSPTLLTVYVGGSS